MTFMQIRSWIAVLLTISIAVMTAVPPLNIEGHYGEGGNAFEALAAPDVRYIPRGPIRINSNADFLSNPAVTAGGDGSMGDPWTIEGFEINGSGKGCGIYIGNTTDHFMVRDCYVHNVNGSNAQYFWNAGVLTYNAVNGSFSGNVIMDNAGAGALIRDSSGMTMENSTVYNNIQGIMIDHSERTIVRGCNASSNNQNGITLSSSSLCTVEGNSAYFNVWGNGIDVYSSFMNEVRYNAVRYNVNDGIYNQVSWSNNITGNIVEGNDNGIVFYYSSSSNVTDNTCSNNKKSGIYLFRSNENFGSSNQGDANGFNGIYVHNSYDCTFSNNTMTRNSGSGMHLSESKRTVVEENILSENEQNGFFFDSNCRNNTFLHNVVEKNEFGVLLTEQSNDNIIEANRVEGNAHGIRILNSDTNLVYHNIIMENPDQALDDGSGNRWNGDYPICGNYWSDHTGSDQFNGVDQNVPGADGISDTPYAGIIGSAGAVDRYPFLNEGQSFADVTPPVSSINVFDIFTSDPTLEVTAQAQDEMSEVVSVEFWYQFQDFQGGGVWSLWRKSHTDAAGSDGWSMQFGFPDGEGYYRFKSRAMDLIGHYEPDKVNAEAQCCYDHTPPVITDNSSDVARTGETFLVGYLLSDNSGLLHESRLVYRFGPGEWLDLPPTGATDGYGSRPIGVPKNSTVPLEYMITAWDRALNNATLSKLVLVIDIIAPNASAGDDMTVNEDLTITFNGSASTDNIGVTDHTWTIREGLGSMTLQGAVVTYEFAQPGVHTVELTVTDAAGNSGTDSLSATVLDITPPVAAAVLIDNVTAGTTVVLNGSGSTDNVGIESFDWNIVRPDTTEANLRGRLVNYDFPEEGVYTVTLTVTDAAGNSDHLSFAVAVLPLADDDDDDIPQDDDDDGNETDDDDGEQKDLEGVVACLGVTVIVLVLALIMVIVIAFSRGRGRGKEEEE